MEATAWGATFPSRVIPSDTVSLSTSVPVKTVSAAKDGSGTLPTFWPSAVGSADALADGAPDASGHSAHVGLTNVDHRLRAAFGNDYGLVVETAVGAGTKVLMRVPKFRSGVRAGGGAFR